MLKQIIKFSFASTATVITSIVYMKYSHREMTVNRNEWKIDFKKRGNLINDKKDKRIVVVGSGIIGLTTAYYLS